MLTTRNFPCCTINIRRNFNMLSFILGDFEDSNIQFTLTMQHGCKQMQNCNSFSRKKSLVWQQFSPLFTSSLRWLWKKLITLLIDYWIEFNIIKESVFQYARNNYVAIMLIPEIKIDQWQYFFMTASEYESDYTNTCDYKTLFW